MDVGKDLSLIGFDVHDELGLASPTIATVRQPEEEIGRIVGHMLLRLLNANRYGEVGNTRVCVKATLQPGRSICTVW